MAEGWRESLDNMNKNCISRLQEYAAKRGMEVRYEEIFPSKGGFGYEVYFVKFIATGSGCRKKEAKEATADRALRTIYGDNGSNQPLHDLDPHEPYRDSDDKTESQIMTDNVVSLPNALTRNVHLNPLVDHPASSMPVSEINSNGQSNAVSTVSEGTNPISAFMEYAQAKGEVGRFEEETKHGPSHRPTFTVCAYMGTRKLAQGSGGNKKIAKRQAAEASLNILAPLNSPRALTFHTISEPTSSRIVKDKNAGICPAGADPICILNEFAQQNGLELTFPNPDVTGADHQRLFTLGATLGNRTYPRATASTIQEAKREASRQALRQLKQNKVYQCASGFSKFTMSEPLTFHDEMAKLCHEKFDSVVADIPDNLAGRKVIAGIVMETESTHAFDVINLASGNRFVKGDSLTTDGQVLVDSHAEILATRGMRRFLYYHLKKLCRGEETSVLHRVGEGKAEVAPGIQFHLYISTAPCGDGAIFTPSAGNLEAKEDGHHHPIFDDTKQGLLKNQN